jgi:hypothetical protein
MLSGDEGDRTLNLLVANQALSQLSYVPVPVIVVALLEMVPIVRGNTSLRQIDDSVSLTIWLAGHPLRIRRFAEEPGLRYGRIELGHWLLLIHSVMAEIARVRVG